MDFSRLKLSVGGGIAIQQSVATRWRDLTGCNIVKVTATECSPCNAACPINVVKHNGLQSVYQCQILILKLSKMMAQEHNLVKPELWVKLDNVMRGYWQRPGNDSWEVLKDSWMATGDIVIMDESYSLRIVDRKRHDLSFRLQRLSK